MKETPAAGPIGALLAELEGAIPDDFLDSEFTRRLLALVPHAVKRWKRLKALDLPLIPEERVTKYFQEAVGCYLHGFAVASTVACRAVVEFALAERAGSYGGIHIATADLERWIRWAHDTRVLPPALAVQADRVQLRGNDSERRHAPGLAWARDGHLLSRTERTGEIILLTLYELSATDRHLRSVADGMVFELRRDAEGKRERARTRTVAPTPSGRRLAAAHLQGDTLLSPSQVRLRRARVRLVSLRVARDSVSMRHVTIRGAT